MRLFPRKKNIFTLFVIALLGVMATGCYQSHSDDDLRTVPSTNNPHIIGNNSPVRSIPGTAAF